MIFFQTVLFLVALIEYINAFTRVAGPATIGSDWVKIGSTGSTGATLAPIHKENSFSCCCFQSPTLLRASISNTQDDDDDVCAIQILMSDTGGGHRASANALRDAFDVLYPGKIRCDIVDLYVEYGKVWPYKDFPALYKFAAKYTFLWEWFYRFGETEFGLWLNVFLQELICFDSFRECLDRPSCGTSKRADMVISVHPFCQDIPLKALANLDSNGQTRDASARTTPFVTVVTDLGGVSSEETQRRMSNVRRIFFFFSHHCTS